MNRSLAFLATQIAFMVSLSLLTAAESETFTGTATRSGTFRRPLLNVDGKRYELEPSASAEDSVQKTLKAFSGGDSGRYAVVGTRGIIQGNDGIIVESIAPVTAPPSNSKLDEPVSTHTKSYPSDASANPQVTTSIVSVGEDRYSVYDYDDRTTRNYTVVIPEELTTVRGLLVHGCYSGGDSRYDWKSCEYYRQFMHLHGFAYVGCTNTSGSGRPAPRTAEDSAQARHRVIYTAFEDTIQVIAAASDHPEMVNAPYAGVGFSAGGGFALNLMAFAPEKTIAAVSYCAPYLFKRRITGPPSDELLHVPAIAITGEKEGFNVPLGPDVDPATGPARIDEVFLPYRPQGATYAWLERQGQGHNYFENRQDVLGMPFLDAAVRARYPKDGDVTKEPLKLNKVDSATGWIADHTTWQGGLTRIVPASEFTSDKGHSSWLPNKDLAFIYRAYSTYDNPLTITSPGDCWPTMPVLEPGSSVPIIVDAAKFPNWKTIAFYDGARKLGEVTHGAATQFTATDLTPGYHVFSVLATDNTGNVRTADPKLVIVKPQKKTSVADQGVHVPETSADIEVVRAFQGNKGPGWKQSIDVAGSVGPEHVVDFDVAGFVVHDKLTGKVLNRLSSQEFWQQVEPAGQLVPQANANDARIIYDPLSKRWFACAAGTTEPDCFLAVSSTSNPMDRWRGAKLPLPRINPYMKLGVDRNGLYVCSCNGHPDMSKGTNCYVLPKEDALAADGPILTRGQTFPHLQFSTMPALDPDAEKAADAPMILLANQFADEVCSELYMYKVTWADGKASISDAITIPLGREYLTPNNSTPAMEAFQPKPGPKLRAGGGGRRLDSVFVGNGSVFGCNGAKRTTTSRPGVLWYEVRISDGMLLQEGFVDSPDRDYIYPSIAVDSQGNIGIGCTGTSQTEFPSVYVIMHGASDASGTMRNPVCAFPGTTAYQYEGQKSVNWSHYSATCIDPVDPTLLWTLQAYGNSSVNQEWCTAWAAFQLPPGP